MISAQALTAHVVIRQPNKQAQNENKMASILAPRNLCTNVCRSLVTTTRTCRSSQRTNKLTTETPANSVKFHTKVLGSGLGRLAGGTPLLVTYKQDRKTERIARVHRQSIRRTANLYHALNALWLLMPFFTGPSPIPCKHNRWGLSCKRHAYG